ncbi:hypothetical protein DICVIV_02558 [Dictyocaulus viviparus]|uniref:Uncharacterized protein n=1 Tax=Dictyocaulus viviparus TaxID=29172 RepID=A0A0D8Y5M7_DICVI|nr:hypothetical protein DICVIV_02558 [Dictyocaulus viviparus]
MAVMSNRFSPPDIVLGMEEDRNRDSQTKITSHSRLLNNDEMLNEQETFLRNPNFELRDMSTAVFPRSPSLLILPRMIKPRMNDQDIDIVETPPGFFEPTTRIFARPRHFNLVEESREKLPTRRDIEDVDQ